MEDTIIAFKWLRSKYDFDNTTEGFPILVFAHSLGTAIASHALAELSAQTKLTNLTGLILMSPFNNFTDVFIYMTNTSLPRSLVNFLLKHFLMLLSLSEFFSPID